MSQVRLSRGDTPEALHRLLTGLESPFKRGDRVGIKIHWGEKGNKGFLPPPYTAEVVRWLKEGGMKPFVFATTVLYSGGRRTGADSLKTAAGNGFTESSLGCPILIADGMDGRAVVEIEAGYPHFPKVQVADVIGNTDGFVILSHFKGHLEAGFGGAIKNLSMGFASRAHKQRMHADAHPILGRGKCNRCGLCAEICPAGAIHPPSKSSPPTFDLEKCIGCAQCIALCPKAALKVFWDTDMKVFQERLVETAAAVWRLIGGKSLVVNALLKITSECDCMPGTHPSIADDVGFLGGAHPVTVDAESIRLTGEAPFDQAHPNVPWRRQFEYAGKIGFTEGR